MITRRQRLTVTVSVFVAMVAFAAAGALAYRPGGSDAATEVDAAVLSPRRAPAVLRDLIAQTRVASRVAVFTRSLSSTSCVAVDIGRTPVIVHNVDQPLTPASALKLTTAAAFLAKVGGKGTFTTTVRGPSPDSAGTVNGDVVLVGGGDPLLATGGYVATRRHPPKPATDLDRLASALSGAGVRHVTGRILVSDDRYDNERRVPTWSAGYTATGDVGPVGALVVNDGFASYSPLVPAADPAVAAGQAFKAALGRAGVVVDGGVARGAARGATLASVASANFSDVVAEMLRESDNNTAESLLKELAHANGASPATRAAGTTARVQALRTLGVPGDAVQAIDGSGLDRSDKATCRALHATLTTKPGGYDLEAMLAVAGETGTLNDRFTTSPLKGRLRAKTGSLNDVTALVGVTDRRASLRFAFISNGSFTDAGGKALQDRLVSALATYPEAPAADALAP